VILVVLASLGYAIATTLAKAKLRSLDSITLATSQLTLASLWLLPVAFLGPHPTVVTGASIGAILLLGIVGSGVAYLIYFNLLAHVSATHVVAVTYLLPIWGLFWGSLAHERIGWTSYAGVAVVVSGLVLLNWKGHPAVAAVKAA
jgi:drug/metabolite transporter (DMT)-like permease